MDELIRRLQERIRRLPAIEGDAQVGHSNYAGESIPSPPPRPPVSMSVLEDVERGLGFRLPTLVRRLYTEVGDGEWGPSAGIIRLRSPEGTDIWNPWDAAMSVEAWAQVYREVPEKEPMPEDWPQPPHPSIYFCEAGCNTSYWLDCSSEAARVFRYDDDFTFETAADSLQGWLTAWLDKPWPEEVYTMTRAEYADLVGEPPPDG